MDFSSPPVLPVKVDSSIKFSSIGGLKEHIKCLREMIIFPLMYPELFKKFNNRPAKGVLFHGPPGTGKTLLARALATECSLVGGRKVAFFMRKGADVMNKYYGESEKNLRMIFEAARAKKPSIIFFDEIDALAPLRKNAGNDRTYDSVVATLLAEMDGLCDRGQVIVIGATNRPDAMDPAVRRPGRFDRELYFPAPEADARRDILEIYTGDWDPCLSDDTLDYLAKITVGYLGSDIKALCSEAVLKAVRRVYPQIYECDYKLLVNAENVVVTADDMVAAMDRVVPSMSRYMPPVARPLPAHTAPLLKAQLDAAATLLNRVFPVPQDKPSIPAKEALSAPSVFLISGECAETHIATALLAQMDYCVVKELSLTNMLSANAMTPEDAVITLFADCRRTGRPCVLFLRDLYAVWRMLARNYGSDILKQLWRLRSVGDNTLLLATCQTSYEQLPVQLQEMFPMYKECVYCVRKPTPNEVLNFLSPVIKDLPLTPPILVKNEPPPVLPRAPPPGPPEEEADVIRRLYREYDNLRIMRKALRVICTSLMRDKTYHQFTNPVDTEAFPDYPEVVQEPMDLSTVMSNIDDKTYYCAKDFLNHIDLICTNAMLYSRIKLDKKIRQDAVASLYKKVREMIADEIDPELELECQLIARRRKDNKKGDDDGVDLDNVIYFAGLSNYNSDYRRISRDLRKSYSRTRRSNHWNERCAKRPRTGLGVQSGKENSTCSKNKNIQNWKSAPYKPKNPGVVIISDSKNDITQDDLRDKPDVEPKKVLINTNELDDILKNVDPLCNIGLEALIDLYADLSKTVDACAQTYDRICLPNELQAIVNRYIQLPNK